MHGLLLRLSNLDDDAASGLRVVGFFDALMEQTAPIETLLRRTADLAECPIGVRTADGQLSLRACPGCAPTAEPMPPRAKIQRLGSGDEAWIERVGAPLPLDALLLERFALAATVSLAHRICAVDQLSPPELIRMLLTSTDEFARRRSAAHLGFDAHGTVHVVAVAGPPDGRRDVTGSLLGQRARTRSALLDSLQAVIMTAPPPSSLAVPVGCAVGISDPLPALDSPTAWHQARTALRLSQPSRHPEPPYEEFEAVVVPYHRMGGFALIAERLTADEISGVRDVQALDRIRGEPGGDDLVRSLEAVAATESLRRAAAMLHLHHNSVAHRVARAEHVLGFRISDRYARSRLMLALVLQRLRDSADRF